MHLVKREAHLPRPRSLPKYIFQTRAESTGVGSRVFEVPPNQSTKPGFIFIGLLSHTLARCK